MKSNKKANKINSKDLFTVNGYSTLIFWEYSLSTKPNVYTEGLFLNEVKILFAKIAYETQNQPVPIKNKEYSFNISRFGYMENFKGIGVSFFQETFEFFKAKYNSYKSAILVYALSKYVHSTVSKFYEIYGLMFSGQNVNDYNIVNLFESIKMTTLEQIQNIIDLFDAKVTNNDISSNSENKVIEELIDLGDGFTVHWSRMLRELLLLTNESLAFDREFDFNSNSNSSNQKSWDDDNTDNFEDFFEKTKTMIISSEYDEALSFFNISRNTTYDEFKKIYRKVAKDNHPDLNNGDVKFEMEMKKINYYKSIIEKYLI